MVTLKITAIGAIASGKSTALALIISAFKNQTTFRDVKHRSSPDGHELTITAEHIWDKPK